MMMNGSEIEQKKTSEIAPENDQPIDFPTKQFSSEDFFLNFVRF